MSMLTTLPAVLALLENARFVFSTCGSSDPAVSITGDSIAYQAYFNLYASLLSVLDLV